MFINAPTKIIQSANQNSSIFWNKIFQNLRNKTKWTYLSKQVKTSFKHLLLKIPHCYPTSAAVSITFRRRPFHRNEIPNSSTHLECSCLQPASVSRAKGVIFNTNFLVEFSFNGWVPSSFIKHSEHNTHAVLRSHTEIIDRKTRRFFFITTLKRGFFLLKGSW